MYWDTTFTLERTLRGETDATFRRHLAGSAVEDPQHQADLWQVPRLGSRYLVSMSGLHYVLSPRKTPGHGDLSVNWVEIPNGTELPPEAALRAAFAATCAAREP